MNKLRLLVTKECGLNCALCQNKHWDLDALPAITDFSVYDEILLTGGEPMLDGWRTINIINYIRKNSGAKIYMYTAETRVTLDLLSAVSILDGIAITIHQHSYIPYFYFFDRSLPPYQWAYSKQYRLNIFNREIYEMIERDQNKFFMTWELKKKKWLKEKVLPADETFGRLGIPDEEFFKPVEIV